MGHPQLPHLPKANRCGAPGYGGLRYAHGGMVMAKQVALLVPCFVDQMVPQVAFDMVAVLRRIGWRLDYFLISAALKPRLKRAGILPNVLGSDHCPVGIELAV